MTSDGPALGGTTPFGVVLRGAASPRLSVNLGDVAHIAAAAVVAFDTLDAAAQQEALAEARAHVEKMARPIRWWFHGGDSVDGSEQ